MRNRMVTALALVGALILPAATLAHSERGVEFPDGSGSVPEYRTTGPYSVVCKPDTAARIAAYPAELKAVNEELLAECSFEHVQAAVDAVPGAGHRIFVLPGLYREEPSLAPPSAECQALVEQMAEEGRRLMSYAEQWACPHLQNLVAVLGDDPADDDRKCTTERLCRLQVEGTGLVPEDVLLDGDFQRLNVIRSDRADGFYLRNVLVQKSNFNSVYVLEQDGFALDRVKARWNDEYGFLTFAVDHGHVFDCETYGNGDAGIYPGSAADLFGVRPSVEIHDCVSHHNLAGYSGTSGNSVYAHDNVLHHNTIGAVMDSFFPNHPGLPQDHATFRGNLIFSNNENYFDNYLGEDAPCSKPPEERDWSGTGTVCPTSPIPVGTGIMTAGGNSNLFEDNWIFDNWRFGTMLFTVPAAFREEFDPSKQLDTSHFNQYRDNAMGLHPVLDALFPNGLDFWWDEGGEGNCWEGNVGAGAITSDPPAPLLPDCDDLNPQRPPNPAKTARLAPCALWSQEDHHPVGCDWMTTPPPPN